MVSLSPTEYEIFYTIASLKAAGEKEVAFSKINEELNRRRIKDGGKPLTKQAMNHHMTKLSKRPFIKKRHKLKNTLYSLENGLYKMRQNPPLCINISTDKTRVMICANIKDCKFQPLSKQCLEKLAVPRS